MAAIKNDDYETENAHKLSLLQHNVTIMVSIPRFSRSKNPMEVFLVI
jgi:hypothetical protein